jgi:hypothetical protein
MDLTFRKAIDNDCIIFVVLTMEIGLNSSQSAGNEL